MINQVAAPIEASPKLDKQIADLVMGFTSSITDEVCQVWTSAGPNTDFGDWDDFCPSTNMGHCWQAAERMRSAGYVVGLIAFNDSVQAIRYRCYLEGRGRNVTIYAKTAELAVCLALLEMTLATK